MFTRSTRSFTVARRVLLTGLLALLPLSSVRAHGSQSPDDDRRNNEGRGAVFTLTNASSGNAVVAYRRAANGTLQFAGWYATGGLGTGAGLGSQGAVVVTDDRRFVHRGERGQQLDFGPARSAGSAAAGPHRSFRRCNADEHCRAPRSRRRAQRRRAKQRLRFLPGAAGAFVSTSWFHAPAQRIADQPGAGGVQRRLRHPHRERARDESARDLRARRLRDRRSLPDAVWPARRRLVSPSARGTRCSYRKPARAAAPRRIA